MVEGGGGKKRGVPRGSSMRSAGPRHLLSVADDVIRRGEACSHVVFERESVYNLRVWAKQLAGNEYALAPPTNCLHATAQRRSGIKLLVYEAISYKRDLQLLVYEAIRYKCVRPYTTSA